MRIALLADLHANREATEACLAELRHQGCEQHVFLGDLVGYGADPAWVVDTVREHVDNGAIAVLGNHDLAACEQPSEQMTDQARCVIEWTQEQLDDDQRAFLHALPLTAEHDDRLYVHANPWNPAGWSYINNRAAATRALETSPRRLTLCGHVHVPALYYGQPGGAGHFDPVPGMAVPLPGSRRWLAIPGACGQPRDGNPAAACAVLDTARNTITFLRVPYDHHGAARKVVAAGLPEALARRLVGGD